MRRTLVCHNFGYGTPHSQIHVHCVEMQAPIGYTFQLIDNKCDNMLLIYEY